MYQILDVNIAEDCLKVFGFVPKDPSSPVYAVEPPAYYDDNYLVCVLVEDKHSEVWARKDGYWNPSYLMACQYLLQR